jgi:hypothetical protein
MARTSPSVLPTCHIVLIARYRLHATSQPFFGQLTKAKQTADPYPPPGAGKDKISYTEALGLVMIDYGGDLRDAYGESGVAYPAAWHRLR